MNIPEDLELIGPDGNHRKNPEERKAINAILEYLRSVDRPTWKHVPFTENDPPPTTVNTYPKMANPTVPMWSNGYAEKNSLDDIPAGTIDEAYFGTNHPSVRVMEKHVLNDGSVKSVWMTYTREQAKARAMVAEDESKTDEA